MDNHYQDSLKDFICKQQTVTFCKEHYRGKPCKKTCNLYKKDNPEKKGNKLEQSLN